MNRAARVQSGAGITTVVALPLLYIGGTQPLPVLTVIGFVMFTIGMVSVPLMRFVPADKRNDAPARE